MAAFFETKGVIEHFVRFRGDTSWSYLGVATTSPEFTHNPTWNRVMADIGGRQVPSQLTADGATHQIATTLSRFNRVTLNKLMTLARDTGGTEFDEPTFRGSLVVGSRDVEMVFRNEFFGTGEATTDLPRGRWYYSIIPLAIKESSIGTRATEVALLLEAHNVFDPLLRSWNLMTTQIQNAGTLEVE